MDLGYIQLTPEEVKIFKNDSLQSGTIDNACKYFPSDKGDLYLAASLLVHTTTQSLIDPSQRDVVNLYEKINPEDNRNFLLLATISYICDLPDFASGKKTLVYRLMEQDGGVPTKGLAAIGILRHTCELFKTGKGPFAPLPLTKDFFDRPTVKALALHLRSELFDLITSVSRAASLQVTAQNNMINFFNFAGQLQPAELACTEMDFSRYMQISFTCDDFFTQNNQKTPPKFYLDEGLTRSIFGAAPMISVSDPNHFMRVFSAICKLCVGKPSGPATDAFATWAIEAMVGIPEEAQSTLKHLPSLLKDMTRVLLEIGPQGATLEEIRIFGEALLEKYPPQNGNDPLVIELAKLQSPDEQLRIIDLTIAAFANDPNKIKALIGLANTAESLTDHGRYGHLESAARKRYRFECYEKMIRILKDDDGTINTDAILLSPVSSAMFGGLLNKEPTIEMDEVSKIYELFGTRLRARFNKQDFIEATNLSPEDFLGTPLITADFAVCLHEGREIIIQIWPERPGECRINGESFKLDDFDQSVRNWSKERKAEIEANNDKVDSDWKSDRLKSQKKTEELYLSVLSPIVRKMASLDRADTVDIFVKHMVGGYRAKYAHHHAVKGPNLEPGT